jgi:hypothetical protein
MDRSNKLLLRKGKDPVGVSGKDTDRPAHRTGEVEWGGSGVVKS